MKRAKRKRKYIARREPKRARDPWGNLRPDLANLQNQISSLDSRVQDIERFIYGIKVVVEWPKSPPRK